MDKYGQIGPEKGDYASDARAVATNLADVGACFVAFAHDGTRMNLILVPRMHVACEGAEPAGLERAGEVPAWWIHVAVTEHGAYWFDVFNYADPGYVASKLDITLVDGTALAEFLTRLGSALR